ncbi:DUF3732 domain-containing protein [Paenibacillus pabuli]
MIDRQDRPITLERMGSGQNWVAYHLLVHLAFHEYFVHKLYQPNVSKAF